MEQPQLENLLLPSRWSKRYPPEVIVEEHIKFSNSESEKARQNIPHVTDIPYGSLEKEKIDIFGTDLPKDAPIFAFVHGGYWQEDSLKRDTYHFIATNLYKNEIKSIFIGYELCPKITMDKILEEIETAVKKCIDYAEENNSKSLHLAGYSAGSHLVAALFTDLVKNFSNNERNKIKSAILIAGIYDLTQIPKTTINDPLNLDETKAAELSPQLINLVEGINTAFWLISAENDSPEFTKQTHNFYSKLQNDGIKSDDIVISNVDHFNIVERLCEDKYEINTLLLRIIKQI